METFEERAPILTKTAEQIARLKGLNTEADILKEAKASLVMSGYDNWNNGTELYSLILQIPITLYASIDEQKNKIEHSIRERISQIIRTEVGSSITEVVISPILVEKSDTAQPTEGTSDKKEVVPPFWQSGYFRLFISHLAIDKVIAHQLKEELAQYQIATFVAHDDIEPTREWQGEIESALRTMDGLTALISPDFINSRWCDQEVGVAMGKSKVIVPLRYGADPHGFMGKFQGIQVIHSTIIDVAEKIFDALLKHELSSQRMTEALVDRLINSSSWAIAKRNVKLLEKVTSITESQSARLLKSIDANGQIKYSFGVPDRIKTIISTKLNP
ncbi:MAG: toll/interleukin-1 receptor domain-containing protein [Candidatus Pacearchaeota archaeon]